jgi:PKD repeat protein
VKSARFVLPFFCLVLLLGAAAGQSAGAVGSTPEINASFVFSPVLPIIGETVTFTSTSTSRGTNNPVEKLEWDLDNNGTFDDRVGSPVRRAFAVPGTYKISLRASGKHKGTDVVSQIVSVLPKSAQLIKPFPVVRLVGRVTDKGVRVRRLTVNAPTDARVLVTCRRKGHSCSRRRLSRTDATRGQVRAAKVIQISRFEGRLLRFGTKLRVYVTKPPLIGKYTRFKIRRTGPPHRIDRCLIPDREKPVRCPAG